MGAAAGAALATGFAVGPGGPNEAEASTLEPFSSCEELVEYAREHRWARNPYPYAVAEDAALLPAAAPAITNAGARAAEPQAGAVGSSASGTNVQEQGIDEPDIAKLSGTTLFRVQGNELRSYDVSGADAVLLGEIELPLRGGSGPIDVFEGPIAQSELLLSGDKAVVIAPQHGRGGGRTQVVEVDVADPEAMSPARSLVVEGTRVNARLQGTTVRLVVESLPAYPGLGVNEEPGPKPRDAPTGATGEAGPAPPDDEPAWLPQATITHLESGESTAGPLTACGDISFPDEFSGLGLLSVITIALDDGIEPADVDSVITDGATVYASATSLYVAGTKMSPPDRGTLDSIGRVIGPGSTTIPRRPAGETAIHRFSASDEAETEYASSGEVPGRLIGQFAMSEWDGILRVASTEGDTWVEGPGESQSMITALAESDGALDEIGRVDGLGRGEEIYAVRFIGDMGYVVTFEQTDPLYTVDLSDPEHPAATGELKIPGYSAYLHPVGDGRLLGIGQAGTAGGTITGAQASLFDVADPERPERLDALDLTDDRFGSAATEQDHHAFMYSPEHRLAVVPVQSYGRGSQASAVAVKVAVQDGGLHELLRLADEGQIERALMVEDRLVTISSKGVTIRAGDALSVR